MQHTELHTYLALIGNQRLPHLEDEIFADKTATTIYLHNLCREYDWYSRRRLRMSRNATLAADESNATLVELYAWFIIRGRWYAAEHIIAEFGTLWEEYVAEFDIK